MFILLFLFGKVQNNNFRSFIHVKYLSSVKKVYFSLTLLDFLSVEPELEPEPPL